MVLLALHGCRPAAEVDPTFAELVAWTEARMVEWSIPGAALVVVEDGRVSQVAGLGVRRWGEPEPVTPDTRFRLGSLSKMVTGSILAELAADGAVNLDAPASDWIGDLALAEPHSVQSFSPLQLLSHASGLQTTGLPNACETDPNRLGPTLAELTPTWALWTEPGVLYNYANPNYALAGLIAERATGRRFVDLAQTRFDAAGMARATYDWELAEADPDHATGHTMDLATGEPESYRGFEERACVASFPSGGLIASARDLGAMGEVLVNRGAGWVDEAGWEVMSTLGWSRDEDSGYGFGLQNAGYGGYSGYVHHGSVGGFYAMLWALPDAGLAVGAMVNVSHSVTNPPEPNSKPTQRIVRHALDLYLDVEEEVAASTVRPVEEWDRFVGVYHSDYALGDVVVTRVGDTLWYASVDGDLVVPLLPYSRNTFQWLEPGTDDHYVGVSFADGEDGEVRWLLTDDGVAERVVGSDPNG